MGDADLFATLSALGFSDLEARVYHELLRSGAATGYGVAKAIGRPGANVYQALNAMQMKGSVLLADASSKAYRAVPPDELLARLERDFKVRLDSAGEALSAIESAAPDDFLYQLASTNQAFERARAMIARAEVIILFDGSFATAVCPFARRPTDCSYRPSPRAVAHYLVSVCVTGRRARASSIIFTDGCQA